MGRKQFSRIIVGILAVVALTLILGSTAWAGDRYKTLHRFKHSDKGRYPYGGLIFDAAGNLYGTTSEGGRYGTVFELTPNGDRSWTESVLHSFNLTDGYSPRAALILDAAGNLYGTASHGGHGYGTVFELKPNGDGTWSESVLHLFTYIDGGYPHAGLIFDAAGNLYGTTRYGGAFGSGTVFELTPNGDGSWVESVLYSFNGSDGAYPVAGLTFDVAGNLYGTTVRGGAHDRGTVFELTPNGDGSWTESVLHSFNGNDGRSPYSTLIFDAAGNLYGTTYYGGSGCHYSHHEGCGTVFELTPNGDGSWTESVLHAFNGSDAGYPYAGLIFDAAGNLYGTTKHGGPQGYGTVFKLTPNGSWMMRVLYSFRDHPSAYPWAGLALDQAGNLYGTTFGDGYTTFGSVFEITLSPGTADLE